jgi:hypothetical protein
MRILILLLFPLFSYSQLSIGILESSKLDADARAFITAAAITNATEIFAINNLVIGLKADGLWTKMKAIYPFVGGSASSHKYNLKDPRDLDAAFRLLFVGGWTHSSTGALPNGTNGYANTYLSPSAQQSLTSGHFSLYSKTSAASTTTLASHGVRNQITALGSALIIRRGIDNLNAAIMWDENPSGVAVSTTTDGKGFYMSSRIAANDLKFYKNGTSIATTTLTQTVTTLSTNFYFLSGINENGGLLAGTVDNKELAFASIGEGLTSTEAANYNTRVTTFQTALSRQN